MSRLPALSSSSDCVTGRKKGLVLRTDGSSHAGTVWGTWAHLSPGNKGLTKPCQPVLEVCDGPALPEGPFMAWAAGRGYIWKQRSGHLGPTGEKAPGATGACVPCSQSLGACPVWGTAPAQASSPQPAAAETALPSPTSCVRPVWLWPPSAGCEHAPAPPTPGEW